MSKYLIISALFMLFTHNLAAQTSEDSVKAVINKMFSAMKDADSKSLSECFADSAILQTIVEKNDNALIITESLKEFADFVGKLQKNDADERITFEMIKTDGSLATAWTPYQFYYKGVFSHCGIDSYQLVRVNGGWKIQYLIDTRRKNGCTQQ